MQEDDKCCSVLNPQGKAAIYETEDDAGMKSARRC